ncbi:hypothetical protein ACFW5D_33715 [Streptomyces sp. NPDC058770]|uniref:hypothetical protein n=1 Tax=unclassified Streptomyces TaxID=2593676 RepID=UPI0036968D8A
MVWSERDAAWADGVAAAWPYAAAHGHFPPPTSAVRADYLIGVWAKNTRAAARTAQAWSGMPPSADTAGPAWTCFRSKRRSLGYP